MSTTEVRTGVTVVTTTRTARRSRRVALVLVAAVGLGALGCWEQASPEWWPQMKRQKALQAYELNTYVGSGAGLTPPEGTVALGNPQPDMAALSIPEQEQLPNPVAPSLRSLKNGEALFATYCSACHGPQGHGNGLVAGPPFGTGPFGLVLPVGGPASVVKALSDGHIYTTITLGRGRMPSYRRIPAEGRWDLVNYIREMNGQGVRQ